MSDLLHWISRLLTVEVALILIRVLLSYFPTIDPWSTPVRLLAAVVDPVIRPFRRILPLFSGMDFSPILATIVLEEIARILDLVANGVGSSITTSFIAFSVVRTVILDLLVVMIILLLLRVLFSLLNADPFHPVVQVIRQTSNPLVRPFWQVVPRRSSIDGAALLALAVYFIAYIVASDILDSVGRHIAVGVSL